jgi:hypothetical protein
VIGAPVLVELANAGRARRPPGARQAVREDPVDRAGSATEMLDGFVGRPITADELDALIALSAEVAKIAESIIDGRSPVLRTLNRLAAGSPGRAQVQITPDGAYATVVEWDAAPAGSTLARLVVQELGTIDPRRLRRCERPECDLIFYDSSRSGTQRWHSEVPCGWRARQQRRRASGSG